MKLISEQTEKKIIRVCEEVVDIPADYYDNPNGPYESSCPFCLSTVKKKGTSNYFISQYEIPHHEDCAFILAKQLLKELK